MKLKARIEKSFLFIVLTLVVIINIVLAIDNAQLKGSLKEFLNPIKPKNYEIESGITEDEVMVVVTGEKGLWDNQKKPRIELTHELTIGRKNNEIIFYRVFPVKSDRFGNIYVGEMTEGTIRKFDPQGNHLLNIGKKGQGPGEF